VLTVAELTGELEPPPEARGLTEPEAEPLTEREALELALAWSDAEPERRPLAEEDAHGERAEV